MLAKNKIHKAQQLISRVFLRLYHELQIRNSHSKLYCAKCDFYGFSQFSCRSNMTSKMIGLRLNYYFADSWNRFDCVVTLLSILALVPNLYFGNASVFRTFRIARLLRLVKIYKGFQSIINTLILCGPSLLNVGALLMLLWFVYAVAGMYLFGLYDDFADAQVLTDQINFGTFYNSFSMVFQCITGEN